MKDIGNIKKIKSPKSSPKKAKNKSYEKFLRGSKETETETNNKDKKVIKVQRKTNSPKKFVKDIRDINDIERKMIQMKDNKNNIKVPTQNTVNNNIKPKPIIKNSPIKVPTQNTVNNNIKSKPIIKNSPKKVSFKNIPKVQPKVNNVYNGPQIINSNNKKSRKVRISDIDVREKGPEETLTENKNINKIQKNPKKINRSLTRNINRSSTRNINRSSTRNINRSSTRDINRSSTRDINRKNRSNKKNRKITIQNKKINEKDIKNVSHKMRIIRNTKTEKIKKELQKQGVKVTGKSDALLKDIYLYSKMCNINITHEK